MNWIDNSGTPRGWEERKSESSKLNGSQLFRLKILVSVLNAWSRWPLIVELCIDDLAASTVGRFIVCASQAMLFSFSLAPQSLSVFFFQCQVCLNLSKCWIGFSDTYKNLAVLLYTSWFVAIFLYLCLRHSQSPETSLFGLIWRSSAEMQIMWCNINTEHQDESLLTISTQM